MNQDDQGPSEVEALCIEAKQAFAEFRKGPLYETLRQRLFFETETIKHAMVHTIKAPDLEAARARALAMSDVLKWVDELDQITARRLKALDEKKRAFYAGTVDRPDSPAGGGEHGGAPVFRYPRPGKQPD